MDASRFVSIFKWAANVALAIILLVGLTGCGSGVQMNAAYSQLLDRTAALSSDSAARAQRGELTTAQMTEALVGQAAVWQDFRDARDGKAAK